MVARRKPPTPRSTDDGDELLVTVTQCDDDADPVMLLLDIREQLARLETKVDTIMTKQSDIDAGTAALTALTGDIATQVAQLQTDVTAIADALGALPAEVDTTALDAAVTAAADTATSLDTAVSGVTATTAPPAPPTA